MEPTKEALEAATLPTREGIKAARELVWIETTHDNRYRVSFLGTWVGISCGDEEQAERGAAIYQARISQVFDDHTAALRAEVEALRARVPVWKRVSDESPELGRTVLLYDPIAPYVVTSATMWQDVIVAGVMTKTQILVWCKRGGSLHGKALRTDRWQYIMSPADE